jgi:hypothetical protein
VSYDSGKYKNHYLETLEQLVLKGLISEETYAKELHRINLKKDMDKLKGT